MRMLDGHQIRGATLGADKVTLNEFIYKYVAGSYMPKYTYVVTVRMHSRQAQYLERLQATIDG